MSLHICQFCRRGAASGWCLPPSVADNRKWVPYFLIRLSVIIWVVGLRPRRRMFRMNSGVRGKGDSRKSLRSTARLLTFHLPNSLLTNNTGFSGREKKKVIICLRHVPSTVKALQLAHEVSGGCEMIQQNSERSPWIQFSSMRSCCPTRSSLIQATAAGSGTQRASPASSSQRA